MTTPHQDMKQRVQDERFMDFALTLARRGLGTTMPNPSVGAVIVQERRPEGAPEPKGVPEPEMMPAPKRAPEHEGAQERQFQIVGIGHTQPGGRPHAETQALAMAGPAAKGAVIYVTLEPCSHFGKTPPCAQALIDAGVARVVVGVGDPDTRVAGRGLAMLRAAGIEVVEGLRESQARWTALGHIARVQAGRPFVQMKLGVSANELVSHAQSGKPVWVTGAAARARVHLMRAQADGVLTGISTVLADDPELTCRLPGLANASPIRIVLDRTLRLPLDFKLAQSARAVPLWVLCGEGADREKAAALAGQGAQIIRVGTAKGLESGSQILNWNDIMTALATRGITRLMVEAGPRIARSLAARSDLVDEYVLFRGTGHLDEAQGTKLWQIWPQEKLAQMARNQIVLFGGDRMISYRADAAHTALSQ